MNVFAKLECGKYKYKMINKYNCIIFRIMLSNTNTVLYFFNIKSTVIIIDLFANSTIFSDETIAGTPTSRKSGNCDIILLRYNFTLNLYHNAILVSVFLVVGPLRGGW